MKTIKIALAMVGALGAGALMGAGWVVLRALQEMDELHETFGPGPEASLEDRAAYWALHGHDRDDW